MAGKQPVGTGSQWEFHLDLLIRNQWFRIFMAPVMAYRLPLVKFQSGYGAIDKIC